MAVVHLLPVRTDPEGSRRLAELLQGMIANHDDPGPRDPQIRSIGFSLGMMVEALRDEMEKVGIAEASGDFLSTLDRLVMLARCYGANTPATECSNAHSHPDSPR